MFAHLMKILEGDDEKRKDEAMHKILPKIIDKALPTQITGDEGEAFQISISVAKEIAEKQKLYDTTPDATGNSEGQPQI